MAENQKEVNKNRVSWADQYWNGGYLKRKQAQKEAREYDRQHPSFSDQYNPAFSRSHRKEAQKQASENDRQHPSFSDQYNPAFSRSHRKEAQKQASKNEPLPTGVGYAAGKKYQQDMERQQALSKVRNEASRLKTTGAKKSEQKKAAQGVASAKKLAKLATPVGLFSLLFQMSLFKDWMYGIALFFAILKDILNFIEVTGVGYIFVIVATLCCSIFIGMMMLLGKMVNGSVSQKQGKIILSWLILLGATIVELIPGLNFIPEETFAVIFIYILMLSDRKEAKTA